MRTILFALVTMLSSITNAQNINGSWSGQIEAGLVKLRIIFNITKDSTGNEVCTFDSPDQNTKGIPASLLFISSDSVCIKVPSIDIIYEGKLIDNELRGTFSQRGMVFRANLKPGIFEYNRPQNPNSPYPYTIEDIKFDNPSENIVFSGTITYPIGYKTEDKVPVILMVTGSGPQNRDNEIFDHKPFLVIADYFARNGIATLRYDDRSVGKSTGKYQAPNTAVVAEDARFGIEFLRSRSQFSKIGVLGHSEGAVVAFMLGAKGLIDFAVCLAAIGVQGDECLYEQAKRNAELSDQDYPLSKEQLINFLLAQKNTWIDFFINYDPTNDIRNTTCPVFAANGDKDVQVLSSSNIPAIQKNLQNNKNSVVKIYPGLNHLFQECQSGLPYEYPNIEQTISPKVLDDLVNWIIGLP